MNRTRLSTGLALAAAVAVLAAVPATASGPAPADRRGQPAAAARWVNAWQGSPVGGGTIPGASCPADRGLDNQTVRNVVFLSAGGDRVRIRLSNAFGTRPLQVGTTSVAVAGTGAATVPGSTRPVRFGGRASVLINDIGAFSTPAADLIQADQQIIAQVHAAGLRIYGATLVPFGGSNAQYGGDYGTPAGERQRQLLNRWIRTSGAFDGVFDFDRALRDPARPDRLRPEHDSGDHLHPGDAGYRKMAETVDLRVLRPCSA